jgi:hypothetical protein
MVELNRLKRISELYLTDGGWSILTILKLLLEHSGTGVAKRQGW